MLMSALGQKRTHAVHQEGPLFDHFVGALLKLEWHIEAEGLCGLEVDHQLVLSWPLYRQVGRLLALDWSM